MDFVAYLHSLPQYIASGITNGCVYAIVAIGFSVIYNSTQVINFAQGEFVMIGAMVAAVMLAKFSLAVAFPIAVLAGCLAGLLVALCVVIPLKKASVVSLIIMTIGASIMLRGLAQLIWGEANRNVPPFTGVWVRTPGVSDLQLEDRVIHLFGAAIGVQQAWVVVMTILLVFAVHVFFKYTLTGQAMRACSMNAAGARLLGISVRKMIVMSFVMAAGLGAIAGVTVSPAYCARCGMGTEIGLKGFCATVLGGLGSVGGGVVAGIVLGIVERMVEGLPGDFFSAYGGAIAYVILVGMLILKPEGLISSAKRRA